MSRLDELVREQCPNGVPVFALGEVAEIRTGVRPTNEDLAEGGPVRYLNGGAQPSGVVSAPNTAGETITIPSRGSVGLVSYQAAPFWCGPLCYAVRSRTATMNSRYLYFALKVRQPSIVALQQTGSIPALNKKELVGVRVPVPPLEVQREIVRILDAFTELEASLDAELEVRRQQYEVLRDGMTSPKRAGPTRTMALGDLGSIFSGLSGKSKVDFADGNARYVSYMGVATPIRIDTTPNNFVKVAAEERQNRLQHGDILFTASSETPHEVGMSSVVTTEPSEPLYLNSFCFGLRPHAWTGLEIEYAKHLFRSTYVRRQIIRTANGVTRFNISKERFRKVRVSIPSVAHQREVAMRLDALYALVNDIGIGLPAELEARRKQYEYYRDKLLTFEAIA